MRFPVRIGIFGIGLDTYWPQFPGLKSRLEGYLAEAAARLARPGHPCVTISGKAFSCFERT